MDQHQKPDKEKNKLTCLMVSKKLGIIVLVTLDRVYQECRNSSGYDQLYLFNFFLQQPGNHTAPKPTRVSCLNIVAERIQWYS